MVFHRGILVLCCAASAACAPNNYRAAPPAAIAQAVAESGRAEGGDWVWRGPRLETSHSRSEFYGRNTVSYELTAWKPPAGGVHYTLWIDAEYGGAVRHYNVAKFADGSSRALKSHRHDTERCQFFNTLLYACIYRDRVSLELSRAELDAAQSGGLNVLLSSGGQDYEAIDVPGNYLQGFLQTAR